MKICFVTNYLPGYHQISAGAEFATYRVLKLLLKKYQISVLSTIPVKYPAEDFEFFPIKVLENFLGLKLGYYYQIAKLIGLSFDPVSFIQSYNIFKKIKPDILHLHHFNILSFSIVLAAKLLKIPIIVSIYDYWLFCPNSLLIDNENNTCEKFQGKHCIRCLNFKKTKYFKNTILYFRKIFFNFFLKKVDGYIVLSSSSSRILQKYGIEKKNIHIIHQPFSFHNIEKNKFSDIEKLSILYAGWLQHRKGLHIILEAMSHILKEIPDAKLYIYALPADKEYERKIYNLIDKLNLGSSIIMEGKKESSEFYDMLNKSNVVVVSEQWENMSPVILVEAMYLGKPIVASRIGGIPEFIKDGENGYLVDAKDSNDFAKKIIKILKDESAAMALGKNARCSAEKFFDENIAFKNLIEVYKIYGKKNLGQ